MNYQTGTSLLLTPHELSFTELKLYMSLLILDMG